MAYVPLKILTLVKTTGSGKIGLAAGVSKRGLPGQNAADWVACKPQRFSSRQSGGWTSEIREPSESLGLVRPLPASQMVSSCSLLPGSLPPCTPVPVLPWSLCVRTARSYQDSSQLGSGPTLLASFNHLLKDPVSKYTALLKYWELGLPHMDLGGDTSQPRAGFSL